MTEKESYLYRNGTNKMGNEIVIHKSKSDTFS